jgi:hypothetical protein
MNFHYLLSPSLCIACPRNVCKNVRMRLQDDVPLGQVTHCETH